MMNIKDAEKHIFKPEEIQLADLIKIDVPVITDAAYDTQILNSDKLEELEDGIRNAKKVGDIAWYVIAVSLAKIIDGGLYSQGGYTQKEYKEHVQERLGIDKRRVSDFLQAGRFLIQHGQKLLNMGWRPDGMQVKIKLANNAQKIIKNETKLLDAIMTKSLDDLRQMIKKSKKTKPVAAKTMLNLQDGKLMMDDREILRIAPNLPDDLQQDLQMVLEVLLESREKNGRIACFAVESRRQAQNAPRVFSDFIKGKFKKA